MIDASINGVRIQCATCGEWSRRSTLGTWTQWGCDHCGALNNRPDIDDVLRVKSANELAVSDQAADVEALQSLARAVLAGNYTACYDEKHRSLANGVLFLLREARLARLHSSFASEVDEEVRVIADGMRAKYAALVDAARACATYEDDRGGVCCGECGMRITSPMCDEDCDGKRLRRVLAELESEAT